MPGLYLVRKPPQSDNDTRSAATGPLQQLASVDRAIAALHGACGQIAALHGRAQQLHAKLESGTETFIAAWNAAHPQQLIRRCHGAANSPACARYTTSRQGLCDACRSEREQPLRP